MKLIWHAKKKSKVSQRRPSATDMSQDEAISPLQSRGAGRLHSVSGQDDTFDLFEVLNSAPGDDVDEVTSKQDQSFFDPEKTNPDLRVTFARDMDPQQSISELLNQDVTALTVLPATRRGSAASGASKRFGRVLGQRSAEKREAKKEAKEERKRQQAEAKEMFNKAVVML